jgi:hypothetical protein
MRVLMAWPSGQAHPFERARPFSTGCQQRVAGLQDVARWLRGNAQRAVAFPRARNLTDLVASDGSNRAAVVVDVDDLDAFHAFMTSMPAETAARAESHGVVMSTATAYVEASQVP